MGKDIRIIVCAAMRDKTGLVICGVRHFDMVMHHVIHALKERPEPGDWEQGFVDQYGVFYNRTDAAEIVKNNGQPIRNPPKEELYSEDIY